MRCGRCGRETSGLQRVGSDWWCPDCFDEVFKKRERDEK